MTTPIQFQAAPVAIGVNTAGYLHTDPSVQFSEPHMPTPPAMRATPLVLLAPTASPFVFRGVPTLPEYGITVPTKVSATVGPSAIRAVANPNPTWNSASGTYDQLPGPSGVGDYRWTVYTLPDPADFDSQTYPDTDGSSPDGSYPLGDATSLDGSDTYHSPECLRWSSDPGRPGPAWHSSYPYKPLVTSRTAQLADGSIANHPVGVAFASTVGAFMWLDMGVAVPQPFSWVIVAIQFSPLGHLHTVLDSGRNPADVGVAPPPSDGYGSDYTVPDGLAYRTSLHVTGPNLYDMTTVPANQGGGIIASRDVPNLACPRFYGMVFNGANSRLWVKGPDLFVDQTGSVTTGTGYDHRYYVLGRRNGFISPTLGCEMFVLEMRFWKHALTEADLTDQYNQLSSTFRFAEYYSSVKVPVP